MPRQAVELKYANRDKSLQLKLNELKEANAKLQVYQYNSSIYARTSPVNMCVCLCAWVCESFSCARFRALSMLMCTQETVDKGETLNKKLRADLDALQRKHASATEAMAQKKAIIERNNEVERQLALQVFSNTWANEYSYAVFMPYAGKQNFDMS